ncbi:hypothetical protein HK100_005891 [Physocladia obscura]|uniref:CBM1 domain-containing protein n=1 Tax=Physocladia obscura TaxID=109957 RepID=A0AAD5SR64_9FUNG|nr:hypothetical protein HK100_005891 [Physocladia obscura]
MRVKTDCMLFSALLMVEKTVTTVFRTRKPSGPFMLPATLLRHTYSVLGYGGNAAAILGDIQAVNTQIFGNADAKWTNEAVAFHGYGGVANTNTVISGLLGYGYPAIMTEFGTVNNAIDTTFVSTLETLGVSWLDFQGIKTSDVSTYVLTSSLYQTVITSAGLCWPSDFGTFPCNESAGSVPTTTTTTVAKTTTTTAKASTTTAGSSSCAVKYGQCGGSGWTGATCCVASTCTYSNPYYSQCL